MGYGEDSKNLGFETILRRYLVQPPYLIKKETEAQRRP